MSSVPSIKITLDKERHLRLDFNAISLVEETLGVKFPEIQDNVGVRDLRAIMWAGLRHEDPDLTIEQVGSMLHMGNMQEVFQTIQDAIEQQYNEGEGGKNPTTPAG